MGNTVQSYQSCEAMMNATDHKCKKNKIFIVKE